MGSCWGTRQEAGQRAACLNPEIDELDDRLTLRAAFARKMLSGRRGISILNFTRRYIDVSLGSRWALPRPAQFVWPGR